MDILTRMQTTIQAPKKLKKVTLYQVRRWTDGSSAHVGFKMRLLTRHRALAIVRFLKARGVEAYVAPFSCTQ